MSIRRVKIRKHWRYQARVAYQGARVSRVCLTREAARQAESALLQKLQQRAVAEAEAAAGPATVRALFEAYAADLATRGKGSDTIACVTQTALTIERLMPEWLDAPVSRVTDQDVYRFRQARVRRGIKPSTINRDLRTLRAMLKRARPEFRFPAGAFFPDDDTRVRWLRPEEELLVLEAGLPAPFREMAQLAAWTLMRLSEIRLLRWAMVHVEQGVILLPRAKGGPRPVMLSAAAIALLRGQRGRAGASEWVFPGRDGRPYGRHYVSRRFRRATRAAGLADFHFHDLRHHGATMALNRGFTAPIVMALGGWKTERMMRRYAAVTDQTLRAAAEAVSGNPDWQASAKIASGQARG